jgi:hypothetical protein
MNTESQHKSDQNIRKNPYPSLAEACDQQNDPIMATEQPVTRPRKQAAFIMPRPTTEPTIQVASLPPKPTSRKKKRSPDDKTPRLNRCPLPGTEEAKNRTFMASMARCKTAQKRQELLQKRGWTEQEYQIMASKPKNSGTGSNKLSRSLERQRASASPERSPFRIEGINLPNLGDVLGQQGWRRKVAWLQDMNLVEEAMKINQYYSGPGRPHLFCVIARFANFDEIYDNSRPGDYWCVIAARHISLNGNQALQLTGEILSAIRCNPGLIRCELTKREYLLLASILTSCCASVSLQDPEILPGPRFDERGIPVSRSLMIRFRGTNFCA